MLFYQLDLIAYVGKHREKKILFLGYVMYVRKLSQSNCSVTRAIYKVEECKKKI